MIISRAPHRVSLFGGGSDLKPFVDEVGGLCVAASINKYNYISCRRLPQFFDHQSILVYSEIERVKSNKDIKHNVIREALECCHIDYGVEIVNLTDIPSKSGMGSSSVFTANLLHALHHLKEENLPKAELCAETTFLEQDILKETVGIQDHIASIYGGFNIIEIHNSYNFNVKQINLMTISELENNLLLFYTGVSRTSSTISASYKKTKDTHLQTMKLAEEGISAIYNYKFDKIGELLHKSWEIKKSLSPNVSSGFIDGIYEEALAAGALGGKLTGAGGGGNLLLYVPPEKQLKVQYALRDLVYVPFEFETKGVHLLFYGGN